MVFWFAEREIKQPHVIWEDSEDLSNLMEETVVEMIQFQNPWGLSRKFPLIGSRVVGVGP